MGRSRLPGARFAKRRNRGRRSARVVVAIAQASAIWPAIAFRRECRIRRRCDADSAEMRDRLYPAGQRWVELNSDLAALPFKPIQWLNLRNIRSTQCCAEKRAVAGSRRGRAVFGHHSRNDRRAADGVARLRMLSGNGRAKAGGIGNRSPAAVADYRMFICPSSRPFDIPAKSAWRWPSALRTATRPLPPAAG